MTRAEVIKETREFYENNPRSVVVGRVGRTTCRYNGPNGEHCAFARYVKDPSKLRELCSADWFFEHNPDTDKWALMTDIEFKEEVESIMDPPFWKQLQYFHDNSYNWGKDGTLTSAGELVYNNLLKKFGEEEDK